MSGEYPEIKPPAILIAEDDWIIGEELKQFVTDLGYQVCGPARTGHEAIEIAAGISLDLMILDIGLKGSISGFEAATKIREIQKNDIPVVFISGREKADIEKLPDPCYILTKPWKPAHLADLLAEILNST